MKIKLFAVSIVMIVLFFGSTAAYATTLDIKFDQQVYIIVERVENSTEELLMTVLFASDPELSENESALICEFEASEIENPLLIFRKLPKPIDPNEDDIDIPEPKEDPGTDGCTAVRLNFRYSPSPIPADAKIIFTQLDLGTVGIQLTLAEPPSPYSGPTLQTARKFTQLENSLHICPSFYGEEGGRLYHDSAAAAETLLSGMAGTKTSLHYTIENLQSDDGYLRFSLITEREYVHRELSPYGISTLYNGEWVMGGGGGSYSLTDVETFDEPNLKSETVLIFTNRWLTPANLYQMKWLFHKSPEIRFAFTLDGTNVLYWNTVFNSNLAFTVNFPGLENLEFRDDDFPPLNIRN